MVSTLFTTKQMQNKSRNNDFKLSNKKCNNGFVFSNNKTGYLVEGQQRQCSIFSNVICSDIICLNAICSNISVQILSVCKVFVPIVFVETNLRIFWKKNSTKFDLKRFRRICFALLIRNSRTSNVHRK
jgi:hypothetical protein